MPSEHEIEVFNVALELPAAKRSGYLDQACAGDPALRQRVEELLKAGEESSPCLDEPFAVSHGPGGTVRPPLSLAEKPGDRIGRYKLLQQIGEGGCGVVYMAEQEEPVHRRVALKVIKLGMDTKNVIARFEAERQALALMDHPNIAKVLDAGATDTGRPFFVMELVRGIKITDYCDQNELSTRERLDLFIQVCHAVQHAHQKGVIHRDIKPSNILVTMGDGVPVPKVIDFGIAKATHGKLTDQTVFTAFEQFIGTPAYMSPEQAEMSALDIDTRSDIYSLGVLLYELLTGQTPFDAKKLLQAGLDEIRRTIQEQEPARPSTCLSTMLGADLTMIAKHRNAEPPKLIHMVRGDLDWIVMKCLEKDRARRYETANGLAMDIQRHVENEPVLARPPSAAYRLQKAWRRNKMAFAAAGAVALSLMVGLAVSTVSYLQAKKNLARAIDDEKIESGLRVQAQTALGQAETARKSETKARDFAEERLYDSLLAQIRATRQAGRVGYRDALFSAVKQAGALDVPQRDLNTLRQEAMYCMGDPMGVPPTTLPDCPKRSFVQETELSPTGELAAFGIKADWDGSLVYSNYCQTNEFIILRRLPSGEEAAHLDKLTDPMNFCFNSNGDQIIAASAHRVDGGLVAMEDAQVTIWSAGADGKWNGVERIPMPGAFRCFNSSNGVYVAVSEKDEKKRWHLVDLKTRQPVQEFDCAFFDSGHQFPHMALSQDGKFFADERFAFTKQGLEISVDVWDLNSHKLARNVSPGLSFLSGLKFSADRTHLACLGLAGCAIYSVPEFQPIAQFKEEFIDQGGPWNAGISFTPAGDVVALPTLQNNELRIWDFVRNQVTAVREQEASRAALFGPDGRFLLTAEQNAHLYWFFETPEKRSWLHHGSPVFSPDGSCLATINDGALEISDAETGRVLHRSPVAGRFAGLYLPVAYSPDGQMIATCQQIWDTNGARLFEFNTNDIPNPTGMFQFTRDSRRLLIGDGNKIDIFEMACRDGNDAQSGLTVKSARSFDPKLEYGPLPFFVLTPDDRHVVCSSYVFYSWNGRVIACDLEGKENNRLLATNINVVGSQIWAQTADRGHLLAISAEQEVVTLDSASGKKISAFPIGTDHRQQAWEGVMALSPDGTKLALASDRNRQVDIYNYQAGHFKYSLPHEKGSVVNLAWSPDSQRLAASGSDGSLSVWRLNKVEQTLADLRLSP